MASKKCEKCRFFCKDYGNVTTCCYIFRTGHRRPCEPGDECTVMEPKQRKGVKANGTK